MVWYPHLQLDLVASVIGNDCNNFLISLSLGLSLVCLEIYCVSYTSVSLCSLKAYFSKYIQKIAKLCIPGFDPEMRKERVVIIPSLIATL